VFFLQETHSFKEELQKVQRRWTGQVLASCFSSHSREVMVLVRKAGPCQVNKSNTDKAPIRITPHIKKKSLTALLTRFDPIRNNIVIH